ncbi:MAG: hypothetical protein IKF41_02905 [Alphaproteobacteria bacterium]|nr:hypothetical protein [Alphaproteobacteria bacterium]
MKKLIIIIAMILPMALPAATMCSKNDTITIVLDPSIDGVSSYYDNPNATWHVIFPYGTIHGRSACLNTNQSSGTADLHDNGELVVGGETNGQYCWCRMTHPALSAWVYGYSRGHVSTCSNSCAQFCASNYVQTLPRMRSGLFSSAVQNSLPQK